MSDIPDTTPSDTSGLPDAVAELVEDLAALTPSERMDLLQELADDLPAPPDRLQGDPGFERVEECQSPVHVLARVEEGVVRLYVDAPPSAAATRALAAILHEAVDGAPIEQVLGLPLDLPLRLGLGGTVSPLRLGGMAGMLGRVQRQLASA